MNNLAKKAKQARAMGTTYGKLVSEQLLRADEGGDDGADKPTAPGRCSDSTMAVYADMIKKKLKEVRGK